MADSFEAHFSDGRTAARIKVSVRFGNDALIIEPQDTEDNSQILIWEFGDLLLADEMRSGQAVRLINRSQSDARLSFVDNRILEPLLASNPDLRKPGMLGHRPVLRVVQWAAGIAALIAILFVGLPRAAEPVAAIMPLAWEEALGEQVFAVLAKQNKFCLNADGGGALKRLTDRLMQELDSRYSFQFAVADSKMINAFAAPGGYIVLYRGLIADAQSPDDVAGVLAHEIGHVVERHATEGIVRATGLALIIQLLLGDPSGALGIGAAAGELLLTLAYSRGDEAEADAIAIELLATAGIDSIGFANFLERMSRPRDKGHETSGETPEHETTSGDQGIIPFLSTHPLSAERAAAVRANGSPGGPAMSDADWRKLQAICE
ncbi:MAG: M48 family metallopeptidase [Proteobacteria bacterium]|nr:M48 family metallopeptidase [Pseudomonadota bacterium]